MLEEQMGETDTALAWRSGRDGRSGDWKLPLRACLSLPPQPSTSSTAKDVRMFHRDERGSEETGLLESQLQMLPQRQEGLRLSAVSCLFLALPEDSLWTFSLKYTTESSLPQNWWVRSPTVDPRTPPFPLPKVHLWKNFRLFQRPGLPGVVRVANSVFCFVFMFFKNIFLPVAAWIWSKPVGIGFA